MSASAQILELVVDREGATPGAGPAPDRKTAEPEWLSEVTLRNMRVLKAQVIPLIGAALYAGAGHGAAAGNEAARWARAALSVIDDTIIAAAAGPADGPVAIVDVARLLRQEAASCACGEAGLSVAELPRLLARPDHLRLLVRELLEGVVRLMPPDRPVQIEARAAPHAEGGVALWLQSAIPGATRAGPDPLSTGFRADCPGAYPWSLCRHLAERLGATLVVPGNGQGRPGVGIHLPQDLLAPEGAG